MLRRGAPQRNFFDDEIFARMVPPDHPLVAIDRAVDFSFIHEAVKDLYSPDQGRPSFLPETLFRALEQAKAKGLGRDRWMIVDGTKVVADVAIRNQLELVREGRKRLVRALQRVQPERAAKMSALTEPLPNADYPDREALLAAESACGEALLK